MIHIQYSSSKHDKSNNQDILINPQSHNLIGIQLFSVVSGNDRSPTQVNNQTLLINTMSCLVSDLN